MDRDSVAPDNGKTLTRLLAPNRLRRQAGDRFFDRGEAYFAEGAVRSLQPDDRGDQGDQGIRAVVQGTRRYRVRLWAEDGVLGHDCTCPLGRDDAFCKHCVAAGLAWHAGGQIARSDAADDADIAPQEVDLRAYLLELDKEDLVSLLVDQADEDERLHRRLTLRAAQAVPGSTAVSVWKRTFDEAVSTDDFVHYSGAYDYASGIEDVIESLEDFLRNGQAEKVIGLAEHGLDELEECLEYVDDSDGWMGGLLARLQALHLDACRRARPDPVELAERLFEAEMDSSYDTFHRAAFVYADVLGEAGLARYRALAETDWAKVKALKPGEDDPNLYGSRFRITSIMEALAEAAGDLEALVAVKSRDLSSPYAFLRIANLYRETGDPDRALEWAERGWQAFPGPRQDDRLRAFLAEAYQGRGRRDEAMALIWDGFAEYPCLDAYRQLERHGRRARQWPAWREKALAEVRRHISEDTTAPPGRASWGRAETRDRSLLVEIFLHESDPEAAWREAEAGGCSNGLWLELAKRREKSHPEDSVRIYEARVTALLRNTGDRVYQEAVANLRRIKALLAGCGKEAAFQALLADIRATHRRKRNLMKMLDRESW